jgi:hypothetical protein
MIMTAPRRQTSDRRTIDRRIITLLSSRPKTGAFRLPTKPFRFDRDLWTGRKGQPGGARALTGGQHARTTLARWRGRVRLPHRGGVVVDSIDGRSWSGGPNLPRLGHPVGRIDPADDV